MANTRETIEIFSDIDPKTVEVIFKADYDGLKPFPVAMDNQHEGWHVQKQTLPVPEPAGPLEVQLLIAEKRLSWDKAGQKIGPAYIAREGQDFDHPLLEELENSLGIWERLTKVEGYGAEVRRNVAEL